MDIDPQPPAAKKRKLASSGPANSQPTQSSFADVLQRLKDDANESKGSFQLHSLMLACAHIVLDAEGGADSWARPTLRPLNPKRDAIGLSRCPPCTPSPLTPVKCFSR